MFEIKGKEQENLNKWIIEHNKTCKFSDPMSQGAIGGRFSYVFTPTGLGMITIVQCACGIEECISDCEDW